MDPSYKSFQNWKKSRNGLSYIKQQDINEINKLKDSQNNRNNYSNNKRAKSVKQPFKKKNLNLKNETQREEIKNTISFQLINNEYIEASLGFTMPPQIINIFKEFQARYNKDSFSWTVPFRYYSSLYKTLLNLKGINIILNPITILPIDFISQSENLEVLKFQTLANLDMSNNKKYNKNLQKITYIIDYTKDPIYTIKNLPPKILNTLYQFQKEGINFGIKKNGRLLIADEMGVGKTIQAIGISSIYKENWPVLILCPSSLKLVWRDEIKNWLSDIISNDKEEIQVFKNSKDNFKDNVKFYILSYDLAIRVIQKIINKKFDFAIADEAHYLKSQDAKRTKYLIPVLQKCKRCILLTGTPILAKPMEIYPLLNALRPDFFYSFKDFGSRYCNPIMTVYGINWTGISNSKELHFMLSKIMIRRLKKDVLSQLPPKKRQKVEIQTDKKIVNQIKVLLSKSKGKIENLISSEIEITIPEITENTKEQKETKSQNENSEDILSCFNKTFSLTGKAKIPGILDYVNYLIDNSCKFLIFAHHMEVLDSIENEILKSKISYIRIDGTVKTEQRQENVNIFQNDDNCLVAILGITACATGLTLTKASTVVFAEMHFTPAIMIQAEDRAHRIGQEHNCVNIHYLYASDTLDEIIFSKLNSKHHVVTTTLDNKSKDLNVEKIKEKIGEFVKINGKCVRVDERKKNDGNESQGNKNLDGFFQMKDLNLHVVNNRRGREEVLGKEGEKGKKKDIEEEKNIEDLDNEDIEKLFLL